MIKAHGQNQWDHEIVGLLHGIMTLATQVVVCTRTCNKVYAYRQPLHIAGGSQGLRMHRVQLRYRSPRGRQSAELHIREGH
jgi:hypothetical protein